MYEEIKAYALFKKLCENNIEFKSLISENLNNGKLRTFGEEEWKRINSQNFISPIPDIKEFIDMFILGYNIGNCIGASRQLSYSYDNVDLVSGILPILKGTLNAEKEGGHGWLETSTEIIDTSLMLVISKCLKETFGYIEEERIPCKRLTIDPLYRARKEFVNDRYIRSNR